VNIYEDDGGPDGSERSASSLRMMRLRTSTTDTVWGVEVWSWDFGCCSAAVVVTSVGTKAALAWLKAALPHGRHYFTFHCL